MRLNESKMKVLKVFFDHPESEFYLSQLRRKTSLSLDTTYRSLCFWKKKGVLRCRTLGRMKLYCLNRCELTDIMRKLLEVERG